MLIRAESVSDEAGILHWKWMQITLTDKGWNYTLYIFVLFFQNQKNSNDYFVLFKLDCDVPQEFPLC